MLVWLLIEVVSTSNKVYGLLDDLLSALSLSLSLSLSSSAERRSSKASASDRTASFSDSVRCISWLGLVRNSSGNAHNHCA